MKSEHSTSLRRVGGSVMLAVPPVLLKTLGLRPGSAVGLAIRKGRLVVTPQARPRYTLEELLAQCEPEHASSPDEQAWTSAPPQARELL